MTGSVDRVRLLVIPLAGAIAVFPLVLHGPSYGHDFNFHLLNWMEAARQFSHGTLYPRWAYSPAYNAGEPRFVFYPPLSWALGAVLGLLLTHVPKVSSETAWTAVPIVYTWICLTAAGFTMHRTARVFAGRNAALIASALYLANPYMLFTAYERAAYAELLAAAWMPLLLLAMLSPRLRASRIAGIVALLWLTNAPAAVIGCYAIGVLAVLRIATAHGSKFADSLRRSTWTVVLPTGAGLVAGIGLAGFYFVPAAWERRFVQISMATIVNMRIDHNFLFEHTGTSLDAVMHDAVLHTASWIAVSLLAAAGLALLACWVERRGQSLDRVGDFPLPLTSLLWAVGIVAFLLTGASNIVWQHAPELIFLQFPWRLLIVGAPISTLAIAAALSSVRVGRPSVVGIACMLAAGLTAVSYGPFHQISEAGQSVASLLSSFQQNKGADPTDEYTPETADNDALHRGYPPYWIATNAAAPAPPNSDPGPTQRHFEIVSPGPEYLILNLRDYPPWRVEVNGGVHKERERRDDGLIAVPVPAGTSTIDIRYSHMPDEVAGGALSVGSVAVLVLLRRRERFARL